MRRLALGGALFALALGAGTCTIHRTLFDPNAPSSFRVTIVAPDPVPAPVPFTLGGTDFTVDVEAIGLDGLPLTSWAGFVRLSVEPGDVTVVAGPAGTVQNNVPLVGGAVRSVAVRVRAAFGPTYLWAEDVGFVPGPAAGAACSNGADDDGDGTVDYPGDFGCYFANDDSETAGTGAAGVWRQASQPDAPVVFETPRLSDVQGRTSVAPLMGLSHSPLEHDSVRIERGTLIVTWVSVDGMYLTDVADPPGFNHLFVYNYSTPESMRACDQVTRIDGIVGEFVGFTELNFPSWRRTRWEGMPGDGTCRIPAPVELTDSMLADPFTMEAYESGLVHLTNVVVPARLNCARYDAAGPNCDSTCLDPPGTGSNCDFNCDGAIASGTAEATCRTSCGADPTCSEWTQFVTYGQYAVTLAGGANKVFVLSRQTVGGYDPVANPSGSVASVTGVLRQVEFAAPPWIVVPRCPDDFVEVGSAAASDTACIFPRTGGPDEPL